MAKVEHSLRYADERPARVEVNTADGTVTRPCANLLTCETCGLTVVHYDNGGRFPGAAHGFDLNSLVIARRLPACEPREKAPRG